MFKKLFLFFFLFFLLLLVVVAASLYLQRRVACLSQEGIDLLVQRWGFTCSRDVVEIPTLNELISGPWAEAELLEEWCEVRGRAASPCMTLRRSASAG